MHSKHSILSIVVTTREDFLASGSEIDSVFVLSNVTAFLIDEWRISLDDTNITQVFQCSLDNKVRKTVHESEKESTHALDIFLVLLYQAIACRRQVFRAPC